MLLSAKESIENPKEIASANHMPNKSDNLGTLSRKTQKWKKDSGACCPPNITISDLGALRLHCGPHVILELHLLAQLRQTYTRSLVLVQVTRF